VVQGNGEHKNGASASVSNGIRLRNVPPATAIICRHTGSVSKVSDILLRNEHLKNLLDNEWIYLMVMDPLNGNKMHHYQQSLNWDSASQK
jgi:uncharacterized protein YbcC (UPF0753/DUF2309 family)